MVGKNFTRFTLLHT